MAGIRGCLSGLAAYGAEAAAGLAAGRAAATALAARLRGGGGDERRGGGGAGRDSEDGRGELGVVETPVSGEVQKLLSEKRALHVKGLGGGLGEPPEVGRDAEDGRDEPGAVENPEGAQELLSGLVGDLRESPEGLGDVQRQRVDELGSRDWLRELERTASGREISLAIKGGMLRVDEIAPLEEVPLSRLWLHPRQAQCPRGAVPAGIFARSEDLQGEHGQHIRGALLRG